MNNKNIYRSVALLTLALTPFISSCEREIDTDVLASSPRIAEVYIDGFSAGLEFQAWGNPTNLGTDNETKYSGASALRVNVPEPSNLLGNWAGGTFYTNSGRDLSSFNCLTFYAKASTAASIEVGLGNYGDDSQYIVGMKDVKLDYNWRKVIVPIPNPSKLTSEKGLFYYSAGAVNGAGYTIWFDDVRFEYIPTLAHTRIKDMTMAGFTSGDFEISRLECMVNLPNGVFQHLTASSKYFTFTSSNPEVATVEDNIVTFHGGKGEAILTPAEAEGSIRITDVYDFAPEPAYPANNVKSVFCDNYTSVGNAIFNNYWGYQTTTDDMINAAGNHIIHYGTFNFVGIVFQEDVDCTDMDYLHMDVLLMDKNPLTATVFTVTPHTHTGIEGTQGRATLETGKWVSIDVPLDPAANPVHEFVLSRGDGCDYNDILIDNIYFYKN